MNLRNVYEKELTETKNVIKHGLLSEKVLRDLKMTTSLYEYIEIVTNYYSEEDNPTRNNWTDVEGFGYGWAWLRLEKYEGDEEKWIEMMHKLMSKMVSGEADVLINIVEDVYFIISEKNETKTYHFITNDRYRTDFIISFSNNELFY